MVEFPPYKWDVGGSNPSQGTSFVSVDVEKSTIGSYGQKDVVELASIHQVSTITTYLYTVGRFKENTVKMVRNKRGLTTYKFIMLL